MRILKVAAIVWAGLGAGAMAQEMTGITVTGEGVVSMAPDMATISLGVTERAPAASDAMAQTSEKVEAILAQLDTLGVEARDRQTSGLYLRPVYDNREDRPRDDTSMPEIVAYEAGNSVSITVRDLDGLGALLDAVISEGANDFNGLQFGLQDNDAALTDARKEAVADAMARATQLAEAAGVQLGDVVRMTESSQGFRPMEMKSAQMRSMDVPIESGEVDISAQVTMQFEITSGQ